MDNETLEPELLNLPFFNLTKLCALLAFTVKLYSGVIHAN